MRPIELVLLVPPEDEVGRVILANAAVAEAGEHEESSPAEGQMVALTHLIREAAVAEGMTVLMDDINLQIWTGRALLAAPPTDRVEIPVYVKPCRLLGAGTSSVSERNEAGTLDLSFLDRLFPVEVAEEEGVPTDA